MRKITKPNSNPDLPETKRFFRPTRKPMAAIATVKIIFPNVSKVVNIPLGIGIKETKILIAIKPHRYQGKLKRLYQSIFSPLLINRLKNINPGESKATRPNLMAIAPSPTELFMP